MNIHRTNDLICFALNRSKYVLFLASLVILFTTFTPSVMTQELSVPAQFVQYLTLPGETNIILRPSKIFVDRHFDEVYVADPGNNRILIFDSLNFFRYEFSGSGYFSMPLDLAVDSKGYIYILAATADGRELMKFDFDGKYLKTLSMPAQENGSRRDIRSIAIDDQDQIYALDEKACEVLVVNGDGNLLNRFTILQDFSDKDKGEVVTGETCIYGGRFYVPVATVGSVYIYDLGGNLVKMIGHKGSNPGEMSFPISVTINKAGLVMVLDKHRFNVICYTPDGKFLGEFGGKGISPGWFYHPTLLAAAGSSEVYVGQVFRNRIQLCTIPEFIQAKVKQLSSQNRPSSHNSDSASKTQVSCSEEVVSGKKIRVYVNLNSQHFLIRFYNYYNSMEVLQNA